MYRMTVECGGKSTQVFDYDDAQVDDVARDADNFPQPGFGGATIIVWTREDDGSLCGMVFRRCGQWVSGEATTRDAIRNASLIHSIRAGE